MKEIESKYQIPKEISPNPWLEMENPPQDKDEVILITDGEAIEEGRYYEEEDEWCGDLVIRPTHWMPRPPLPLPKRK